MPKIKSITFNNFKYFYQKFELELDRKNLLLYGENGSGKSSIYWGLYTFFQSVYKSNDDIKKYFNREKTENLVNRFCSTEENSSIQIKFENGNEATFSRQISFDTINTKDGDDIKLAARAGDFLNYRILSKLYDFQNSEFIDIFSFFEKELLMFMNFRKSFSRRDGSEGSTNSSDWWNYIKSGLNPHPRMHDQDYKNFQKIVDEFNEELQNYIRKITERSNKYLIEHFHLPFNILFEYDTCSYNDFIPNTKSRSRVIKRPRIYLKVKFNHDKLDNISSHIQKPHTFLNEAKLSAIALSIRFALLEEKHIDEAAKILVLDDLLISLDMSNRDVVLEIILNLFNEYQLIILTHDKAFYNLIKRRIETDDQQSNWIFKELYQDIDDQTKIPKPFLLDTKSYLSLATKYFKICDYPACANYLRKESERILIKLLPNNKSISLNLDDGCQTKKLEHLICSFEKVCTNTGVDFASFKRLKEYKDLLLNPLSHNNIHSPIYRGELEKTFDILFKLNQIKTKSFTISNDNNNSTFELHETDKDNNKYIYYISPLENLYFIKDLENEWHINNPEVTVNYRINKTTEEKNVFPNKKLKLSKAYDQIRFKIGNKTKNSNIVESKDLKEIIYISGEKVNNLLD